MNDDMHVYYSLQSNHQQQVYAEMSKLLQNNTTTNYLNCFNIYMDEIKEHFHNYEKQSDAIHHRIHYLYTVCIDAISQ